MDKLTRIEVDCSTGEQTVIELTAEEIADLETAREQALALAEQAKEEEQAKEALKDSALAKLTALGLTEEEAKALIS